MFGWGLFMCDGFTFAEIAEFIAALFGNVSIKNQVTLSSMNLWGYIPYIILGFLIVTPFGTLLSDVTKKIKNNKVVWILNDISLVVMYLLCIASIIGDSYNPFIYYRF